MNDTGVAADAGGEITAQLRAWSAGDQAAVAGLFARLYSTLRQLAERALSGERTSHTLGTGGLVSEAYFRLLTQQRVHWRSREHFVATAARMMRRVLIDHARRRVALKRGAGAGVLPLDEGVCAAADAGALEPLLALHDALRALEQVDREQSEVVELRFFGGLENEEIARYLGLSVATVERRWRVARAWLYRRLSHGA